MKQTVLVFLLTGILTLIGCEGTLEVTEESPKKGTTAKQPQGITLKGRANLDTSPKGSVKVIIPKNNTPGTTVEGPAGATAPKETVAAEGSAKAITTPKDSAQETAPPTEATVADKTTTTTNASGEIVTIEAIVTVPADGTENVTVEALVTVPADGTETVTGSAEATTPENTKVTVNDEEIKVSAQTTPIAEDTEKVTVEVFAEPAESDEATTEAPAEEQPAESDEGTAEAATELAEADDTTAEPAESDEEVTTEALAEPVETAESQASEQPEPNEAHICTKENEPTLTYHFYESGTQENRKCELRYIHSGKSHWADVQPDFCKEKLTEALRKKIVEEDYDCKCSTQEVSEGITQIFIPQITEGYICEELQDTES